MEQHVLVRHGKKKQANENEHNQKDASPRQPLPPCCVGDNRCREVLFKGFFKVPIYKTYST